MLNRIGIALSAILEYQPNDSSEDIQATARAQPPEIDLAVKNRMINMMSNYQRNRWRD